MLNMRQKSVKIEGQTQIYICIFKSCVYETDEDKIKRLTKASHRHTTDSTNTASLLTVIRQMRKNFF